jgi:hypothetical protein
VALAMLIAGAARADVISVDPSDYSGSRSASAGELTTMGPWAGDPIRFSWKITYDTNTQLFTYSYTLAGWAGRGSGLSHWDLTTSDGRPGTEKFTEDNVFAGTSNFINKIGDLNSSQFSAPTDSYGIRWDKQQDAPPQTYVLVTDRAPIWGSFDAKAGGGLVSGAYNIGWSTWNDYLADTDITNFVFTKSQWVPVPDTKTAAVPEPASVVLVGLGLVSTAFVGWKRSRRQG